MIHCCVILNTISVLCYSLLCSGLGAWTHVSVVSQNLLLLLLLVVVVVIVVINHFFHHEVKEKFSTSDSRNYTLHTLREIPPSTCSANLGIKKFCNSAKTVSIPPVLLLSFLCFSTLWVHSQFHFHLI